TLSELSQTSATVNCGVCTLTGDREFAGQTVASAKASATASLSRSFSDTTQTAKFTASGEADLFVSPIENAAGRFFLKADLEADGGVTFEVFDHAETITINKSVSGSGLGTAGIVLIGPGGEVFRHMIDLKTGLIPGNETLPSSLSLPPGRYNLGLSVSA